MKTKRIISLILALTLLMCVFSILPVHAEEAESSQAVEILRHNVVYKDTVQIAYAVNCEVGTDVTVKYTVDGETYDAVLYSETYVENGKEYPIYVTHGFYATDFTDVVTATAYIGDEVPASAVYDEYSVAEYFYAMLYKNGYINYEIDENNVEATKPNSDKKNLYLAMLDYGKYSQEVLINNKGGNVTLITDYCYLYAAKGSGVTINGEESALVLPGSEVALAGGVSYILTHRDGSVETVSGSYTAVAGAVVQVSAQVEDSYTVMDYESGASNDYVYSVDGNGATVSGDYVSGSSLAMGLATSGDNTYLQVRNPANSGKVGVTTVNLSNTLQSGNCYTFETKMSVAGGTAGYNLAQIKFVNVNGGEAVNLNVGLATVDGKTGVSIATTGDNASIAKGTKLFDAADKTISTGTWFTIRIEFYFEGAGVATAENTYMKLYVDEVLAYDGLAHWAIGAGISRVEINHISAGKTHNSCYDDIFFTRTDKDYVAD